ncbi:MAG: hypothetical protein H7Y36_12615 [Armatimonadetes bacterium]|nr:hypothetical protein [Akkermansiaceae bacterium]
MRRPPRAYAKFPPTATAIATVCVGFQLCGVANAQNSPPGMGSSYVPNFGSSFASRLANSIPISGFNGIIPPATDSDIGLDETLTDGFKGVLIKGAGVTTTYDSNFFLAENNPDSELITSVSGMLTYLSDPEGGAPFSIIASYNPAIQTYLENSENNGIDQSGNIKMSWNGSRTSLAAFVNVTQSSGTDPIIGEFVSETLYSAGIEGRYQIAPRTSISASFAAATSDYGSGSAVGSNIYTTSLSGSWAATEYFRFGPEIQYNVATSDNSGTREAWQFLLQGQYQVGTRIQVSGSIGLDYATNSDDDGSASAGLTGSFNANYSVSERLSWSGSVVYVTVPSPDEVDYVVNNLTISTALSRKLLRAVVDVGLALNIASYEGVGPVTTSLEDENNLNAFVTYSRTLFLERVNFVSSLFYSVNNGQSDWTQFQLSVGLNAQF